MVVIMNRIEEIACYYISLIRSVALVHQTNHWLCNGDNFYGNHLMFDRIYKSAAEDSDLAAEKLIGVLGPEVLDLDMQATVIGRMLKQFSSGEPTEASLDIEKEFLNCSKKFYNALEEEGLMTLGVADTISEIASHREEAVYLLKQTQGQNTKRANKRIAKIT